MLRITFDKKAMLKAGAIVVQERRGSGNDAREQNVLRLATHQIDITSDGSVYLYGDSTRYEMPSEFEPFVSEVSYYDNFGYGFHPTRRIGEYRLASAIGELGTAGTSHYHLKLRAKNVKDLRELFHLIRQGQIWPAKDYEEAQVPPPFRHLKDALAEIWALLRRDIRDRLYRIKERVINIAV